MEKRDPLSPNKKMVVFGIRPVSEALRSGREFDRVLMDNTLQNESIRELATHINSLHIPLQKVPAEKLNRITRKNHQGVIALLSWITYASLDHIISESFRRGREPKIIILDRITDVRNFGAIARTAEGLGFDALVIPGKGSAQINEDAMKSSSGALNHIPVCREKNLTDTLQFLANSGLRVVACTEKANTDLYDADLTGPLALVFGSEEDGISNELLRKSHQLLRIPMFGSVASFNVSVSVAMVASEVIRQKKII